MLITEPPALQVMLITEPPASFIQISNIDNAISNHLKFEFRILILRRLNSLNKSQP